MTTLSPINALVKCVFSVICIWFGGFHLYIFFLLFLYLFLLSLSLPLVARGKGKKTKKLLLPLLLLFKLKAAALLPLVLGFLALIAFKALIIGKLALLLSGIIGLKKLFESKHSAQNYEVVASHPHGGFDEHSHYSRSMDDAHNLAYGAHQQWEPIRKINQAKTNRINLKATHTKQKNTWKTTTKTNRQQTFIFSKRTQHYYTKTDTHTHSRRLMKEMMTFFLERDSMKCSFIIHS